MEKVVENDMNGLHLKPSNAVDCGRWRELITGNWSYRSSESC